MELIYRENILNNYVVDSIRYYNDKKKAFQIIKNENILIREKIVLYFHISESIIYIINKQMGASKRISKKFETKKGPEKKERKRKRKENFSKYILKVLKSVHNDVGISKGSMIVMNGFIKDLFEQISLEASKLVRNSKVHTLSAKEIQSSVKLLLPGELARHAIIEGTKAVNKIAER